MVARQSLGYQQEDNNKVGWRHCWKEGSNRAQGLTKLEREVISCRVQNKGFETVEQLKRKATAAIPVSFHGHVKLHKRWSQSIAAELEVSR